MEKLLCDLVKDTEANCSDYPVNYENENTHICIEDLANNKCKEQILCGSVTGNMSEINCSAYPVKLENTNSHICIEDSENDKCKEQILCESVTGNINEINCSAYPVFVI